MGEEGPDGVADELPKCSVTLRMWCPDGRIFRTNESTGTDRCANLIDEAIRGLSPEELESLKKGRYPADFFVGLFAGKGPAVFPVPKEVWTALLAANLEIVFDLYPRQSDPLDGGETELAVEGPPDLVACLRDRCPRLSDGRPVRWSPDASSSLRFRFRSAHGQGSAILDREAIRILEESRAALDVILGDA